MKYLDRLAKALGHGNYEEYLRSPYWRTFVLQHRKPACFCCKSAEKLQVHHLTYERMGQERPEDVVTVCDECHVLIHAGVKEGQPLAGAHFILLYRMSGSCVPIQPKSSKAGNFKKEETWCHWAALRNVSLRETPDNVKKNLMERGLIDRHGHATEKAYQRDVVIKWGDEERWNKKKYLSMMHATRKVNKMRRKGQFVGEGMLKRTFLI